MTYSVKALMAAFALRMALMMSSAHADEASLDDRALKALEQAWTQAAAQGDRATLDGVLDSSFVEVMSNGARRTKRDVLFSPALPRGAGQSVDDVKVRVMGDIAIVTGVDHYTPNAFASTTDYAFVDLYVRRADGWRLATSKMEPRSSEGA